MRAPRASRTCKDEYADERVDREIPLLYATSTGDPYERSEFELVEGPAGPRGRMRFKVRLFADNDQTVVEQSSRWNAMRRVASRIVYKFPEPRPPENGKAVPVSYGFLDGEVTYRAGRPARAEPGRGNTPDRVAIAATCPTTMAPPGPPDVGGSPPDRTGLRGRLGSRRCRGTGPEHRVRSRLRGYRAGGGDHRGEVGPADGRGAGAGSGLLLVVGGAPTVPRRAPSS